MQPFTRSVSQSRGLAADRPRCQNETLSFSGGNEETDREAEGVPGASGWSSRRSMESYPTCRRKSGVFSSCRRGRQGS